MTDVMMCFTCCITQRPPQRKRRIDRSMIGYPTDFKHTGHIGSGDVGSSNGHVSSVQTQMSSKGGYQQVSPVGVELSLVDVERS